MNYTTFCGWISKINGVVPPQATHGLSVQVLTKEGFQWARGGGRCYRGIVRAVVPTTQAEEKGA